MKTQLQEAKKIEEHLDLQLKKRIQESERIEEDIMHLRKKIYEGYIKSKFESSSNNLDDILSSQRPSRDLFAPSGGYTLLEFLTIVPTSLLESFFLISHFSGSKVQMCP